jgi:hypothetical protein
MSSTNYTNKFKDVDGKTADGCATLVNDPNFSHTRMGKGLWRNVVYIYHLLPDSPSGVILVGSTDETTLRACNKQAPLPAREAK